MRAFPRDPTRDLGPNGHTSPVALHFQQGPSAASGSLTELSLFRVPPVTGIAATPLPVQMPHGFSFTFPVPLHFWHIGRLCVAPLQIGHCAFKKP